MSAAGPHWQAAAEKTAGSWWQDWSSWLHQRCGEQGAAPQADSAGYAALAPAVPDRVLASSGSTPMWGQYLFGKQRDGRRFAPLNCINGGLGARPDRDGVSCLTFPVNVGNTPAEVIESDVPVLVRKRALWQDSAGPGRFRGGFGQEFEVEVLGGELGPDGPIVASFRAGRFRDAHGLYEELAGDGTTSQLLNTGVTLVTRQNMGRPEIKDLLMPDLDKWLK